MTKRDFFENTVKIVVGKGEEKIEITNISRDRLSEVSEFFAAGFSDRWKSGLDGVIELEEVDPKLFRIFLAWAFAGNIENSEDYIIVKDKDEDVKDEDVVSWEESSEARHFQLVKCYLLGQLLLAPNFRNAVMDLIIESYKFHSDQFHTVPRSLWESTL
jgi:hypothetical protein